MTNPVENKAILARSIFYSNLERTRVEAESPSAAHRASPRARPWSPRRPARCVMTVAVQSVAFPLPWNACSENSEMTPGRPVPAACNPGRPAGYQRPPEPSRRATAHWPQAISAGGCAPTPLAPALPRLSEKPSLASGTNARPRAFVPLQAWGSGLGGCALPARADGGRRVSSGVLGGGLGRGEGERETGADHAVLRLIKPGAHRTPQVRPHLLLRPQSFGAAGRRRGHSSWDL